MLSFVCICILERKGKRGKPCFDRQNFGGEVNGKK